MSNENKEMTMKKMYLILGLALGMLTAACSTDLTNDVLPTPENEVVLGVSIEDAARTQLGSLNGTEYPVLWSAGDKIWVNGKTSNEVAAADAGAKAAKFTVSDVTAPYHIVYPAEVVVEDNSLAVNNMVVINVPVDQEYTKGSFADKTAVMACYAEGAAVTMKHLYGFVKLTIAKGDDVALKSVLLEAVDGTPIAGDLLVKISKEECTIANHAGVNYIHVSGANGIPYEGGKAEVIIAVPAGIYSKGFKVTVEDAAGKAMSKTAYAANGKTIQPGVMLAMEEFTYVGAEQTGIVIRTAQQLVDFHAAVTAGDYTAYKNAEGVVVLGGDIDMTGVENWAPAATFDGVFDGKGYKVKNWKTSRALFGQITGTVKNVVVDKSCAYTYSVSDANIANCAAIVEDAQPTAVVENCVNYAPITVTDISAVGTRIGGVLGTLYGKMSGCINYGKVSVTSAAVNNNQNIGGVVGYVNTNAGTKDTLGTEFLVDCANYGEVDVHFDCLPKKVCVGGIAGGTQMSKSSAAVCQGTIKGCANHGKVSYHFGTLASGTYGNVGGVIGYSQAILEDCSNHGEVSFTTPTDDLTQGGTRPAAGGVVGSNIFTVKKCNNYGKLYVKGVWAAGTNDAEGSGCQAGSSFGGVAGNVGVYNVYNTDNVVEDCNNYGELDINDYCKTEGGTKGWHAGVVGYTSWDVKNCHNYGKLSLKNKVYEHYSAGVLGENKGGVYNCTNYGETYAETVAIPKAGGGQYFGGVIGYACTVVDNCHLKAPFTVKADGTAGSLRFTGVVGQVKTLSERTANITNCSVAKEATLTFTTNNVKANYIGTIVGLANNGVNNCVNNADMNITITTPLVSGDITYIGGIAGSQQEDFTHCTNNGNITADMCQSTAPLYAGTLVGANKKAEAIVANSTNNGNYTINNAGNTETIGVFVGSLIEGSSVDNASCVNNGKILVNGSELGAEVALSVDGKQWQLPEDIAMGLAGAPGARIIADLGVSFPGMLTVAVDYESIYGSAAAGYWAPYIQVAYTVEVTDATSGKILLQQTNMYNEVTTTPIPYSNLTADSVMIDFTNMLGATSSSPCTLFTGNVNLSGGAGVM